MEGREDGDRRLGYFAAGSILLALGLGGGLFLNVVLHRLAPSGGLDLLLFRVYPGWSPYATVALGLGVLTSLVGGALLYLGWSSPTGPLSLFDTEGRSPPDPDRP
jgi:hypothetical protein